MRGRKTSRSETSASRVKAERRELDWTLHVEIHLMLLEIQTIVYGMRSYLEIAQCLCDSSRIQRGEPRIGCANRIQIALDRGAEFGRIAGAPGFPPGFS